MNRRSFWLKKDNFQLFLDCLNKDYQCIGPVIRDQALVFDRISNISQLPVGYIDHQEPGKYTLEKNDSSAWFSVLTGPQGIKPHLFQSEQTLWQAVRKDGRYQFVANQTPSRPVAFIGARACDVAALQLQDKHFLQSEFPDPHYKKYRDNFFLIGVNCSRSHGTCFCHSTGDGPHLNSGYDLALTELPDGFIVESDSQAGYDMSLSIEKCVPVESVTTAQLDQKQQQLQNAASQQRTLPDRPIAQLLPHKLNHNRWLNIAERCLSCGNCTMTCPSCFCHKEFDRPAHDLQSSEHVRQWDSCFTAEHSYIAGKTFRQDTRLRYRQWLTHKFSFWVDQYDRPGCTGCGRCITWCPVGIDITEELEILCREDSCHVQ